MAYVFISLLCIPPTPTYLVHWNVGSVRAGTCLVTFSIQPYGVVVSDSFLLHIHRRFLSCQDPPVRDLIFPRRT